MTNLTETLRIANAYRMVCEGRGSVDDAARVSDEWGEWCVGNGGDRDYMPSMRTQDGYKFFRYVPEEDAFVYGRREEGTGEFVPEGSMQYDHRLSLGDNVDAVCYEISHRYGY